MNRRFYLWGKYVSVNQGVYVQQGKQVATISFCEAMLRAVEAWLSEPEARVLAVAYAGSFGVSVGLLLLWRLLIAPAIPSYKTRSEDDRVFLANSFVSLYPAFTAPLLAIPAIMELPLHDNESLLHAPPSTLALRAVGLSAGYMLYDTVYCLSYRQVRSPLIILHHAFSFVLFPYATLRHRSILLVLFFVSTELTNLGQHLRILLLKLGHEASRLYLWNGVAWAVAFFVVRILPSPYFFYKLVSSSYEQYSTFDFYLAAATVPLPFMLNSFWFYMLSIGVLNFRNKWQRMRGGGGASKRR